MFAYLKQLEIFKLPPRLKPVYLTITLSEFSNSLATPLFAFLFFSEKSSLLPHGMSAAERGVIFGIFVSLYKAAGMLSSPIFGAVSDLIGRKKIFMISISGMVILSATALISTFTGSVWGFIFGVSLYSFFWSHETISSAAITDLSPEDKKITYLSIMQFFIGIGVFVGPMTGGFLGDFTVFGFYYVLPFIALFAFSIFLLLYVNKYFLESLAVRKRAVFSEYFKITNFKAIFTEKTILLLFLIHIFNQLSWGTYYSFIPAVMKTVFFYDVKSVGIFVGLIGLSLTVTSGIILPRLKNRLSNFTILKIACFVGTTGVLMAYISSCFPDYVISNIFIWLSILPVAGGDVILFCILISFFTSLVEKQYQGFMIGIVYIIGRGMWCIGAILGGYLMKWQLNASILTCPVSMFILLAILLFVIRRSKVARFNNN